MTDDTKKDGPKWYLNLRAAKPFGFSSDELLLVSYLKGDITEAEYLQKFQSINEANGLNWRPKICLDRFERRFFGEMVEAPGSLRDHQWISDFAREHRVDIREKLKKLHGTLPAEPLIHHSPRTREELLLSDYPLTCPKGREKIWEDYRTLYKFLRGRKYSLEVSVDIVIAKVLERLGHRQGEIEETISALAPKAENNPMYHRLAVMQGRGVEDGDLVRECVEKIGFGK